MHKPCGVRRAPDPDQAGRQRGQHQRERRCRAHVRQHRKAADAYQAACARLNPCKSLSSMTP